MQMATSHINSLANALSIDDLASDSRNSSPQTSPLGIKIQCSPPRRSSNSKSSDAPSVTTEMNASIANSTNIGSINSGILRKTESPSFSTRPVPPSSRLRRVGKSELNAFSSVISPDDSSTTSPRLEEIQKYPTSLTPTVLESDVDFNRIRLVVVDPVSRNSAPIVENDSPAFTSQPASSKQVKIEVTVRVRPFTMTETLTAARRELIFFSQSVKIIV